MFLYQVEEQRVSGGVNLEYFHAPIGSLYQGLGNVMLRIEPTGKQAVGNTTVLLNAHYDSTLGSPGDALLLPLYNIIIQYNNDIYLHHVLVALEDKC